jgi:hypothetical protein
VLTPTLGSLKNRRDFAVASGAVLTGSCILQDSNSGSHQPNIAFQVIGGIGPFPSTLVGGGANTAQDHENHEHCWRPREPHKDGTSDA